MATKGEDVEEEDDYLSMAFPEPAASTKVETFSEKRRRLAREAEARAHQPSKASLAAQAEASRQQALETALPISNNKGAAMMAKLGYKPGTALGKEISGATGLITPIGVEMKEDRSGIGALSERKRKFRADMEEAETKVRRAQEDEGGFRERVAKDREERRLEGMWRGAMKVLEGLHGDQAATEAKQVSERARDAPVLFRPLVQERVEKERERRRRADFEQGLGDRAKGYGEDSDEDDGAAGRTRRTKLSDQVEDLEDDNDTDDDNSSGQDLELLAYLGKEFKERLVLVVLELRKHWQYCFWCKYRYPSQEALKAECPGIEEDEHG